MFWTGLWNKWCAVNLPWNAWFEKLSRICLWYFTVNKGSLLTFSTEGSVRYWGENALNQLSCTLDFTFICNLMKTKYFECCIIVFMNIKKMCSEYNYRLYLISLCCKVNPCVILLLSKVLKKKKKIDLCLHQVDSGSNYFRVWTIHIVSLTVMYQMR